MPRLKHQRRVAGDNLNSLLRTERSGSRRAFGIACLLLACFSLAHRQDDSAPPVWGQVADEKVGNAPAGNNPGDTAEFGRLIRIIPPINDSAERRIKRAVEGVLRTAKENGAQPVLIFEIHPGPVEVGRAHDMAKYIASPALGGARTVAYIPKALNGHAMLLAMACQQIIMHPSAELGTAWQSQGEVDPATRSIYVEFAKDRRTIPEDVAQKILDKNLELVQIETDQGREILLSQNLEERHKTRRFEGHKVLIEAGQPAAIPAATAVEWGLVKGLADSRDALARTQNLPLSSTEPDPSVEEAWRPIQINVRGPITPNLADQIQNTIKSQVEKANANFILLWIDSAGGSPDHSMKLAQYLATMDPQERRTVAYIPERAQSDAVYLAMACDHIIVGPAAIVGGPGDGNIPAEDLKFIVDGMTSVATQKKRNTSLVAAMIDPSHAVYEYTRKTDGLRDYFTTQDAAALPDADEWTQGEEITKRDQLLRLSGDTAVQYGLARDTVDNFDDFKAYYSIESLSLAEPGWVDQLVDALRSPAVSVGLLLIGFGSLLLEIQAPGVGLGLLVGAVCFVLYFWAQFLGGTSGWLEALMFVLGLAFVLVEFFVIPGIGIFGLGGGLLIMASLVLASQTFVWPQNEYQRKEFLNHLLVLFGAGVGTAIGMWFLRKHFQRTPMLNRMLLAPPSQDEQRQIAQREALTRFEHLLNTEGISVTPLVPAGKVRFGDEWVDVVSDGGFIDRNKRVVVVEVQGNRVVVSEVLGGTT